MRFGRRTEILHSLPRVDKGVLLRNRLAGRRDFISSYGRVQPPNNGRRTGSEK